jgi:hypothetical protein
MRRTIVAVAVGALAISPLAACDKSNAPPTTTITATSTTTNTPSLSATSDTKADLDAALLTLTDLPPGYTPNTEVGPDYTVSSGCSDEAITLDSYRKDAQAKTGTAFSTTSGRLVVQSLTLLSGDIENNTLAALKKAVARCGTWNIDRSTYTMSKADYGPYGEESLSYRVTVTSEVPFIFDIVFLRKANLLVGIMVAGQGSAPPKDARAIFDTAARKLPKQ